MKKIIRAVIFITLFGMLSGLLSGCSLAKRLFAGRVADGDGMVNYNGYFLELYEGDWASADGRYKITFDGYRLWLGIDGVQALETEFYLHAETDDTSAHNDIELITEAPAVDGAAIARLYSENGTLYMQLDRANGESETVELVRTDAAPS